MRPSIGIFGECLGLNGQHTHLDGCVGIWKPGQPCWDNKKQQDKKHHEDKSLLAKTAKSLISTWPQDTQELTRNLLRANHGSRLPLSLLPDWAQAQIRVAAKTDIINPSKVILTEEQQDFGRAFGILTYRDLEGSIARQDGDGDESDLDSDKRDRKSDEFPNLTKNEEVLTAIGQNGRCWVHGGALNGHYSRGNSDRAWPLNPEQFHYPSKAAARDAGICLTKANIHMSCHICNALMSDLFGVNTSESDMREKVLRKVIARRITFLEPSQVKEERRMVEQIIYKVAQN